MTVVQLDIHSEIDDVTKKPNITNAPWCWNMNPNIYPINDPVMLVFIYQHHGAYGNGKTGFSQDQTGISAYFCGISTLNLQINHEIDITLW